MGDNGTGNGEDMAGERDMVSQKEVRGGGGGSEEYHGEEVAEGGGKE